MQEEQRQYWFAAKRHGIGWGLPVKWQGWATVAIYAALLVSALRVLRDPVIRLVCIVALTVALIAIIVWKGERPFTWRWGRN
jgi:hypothetical protein